jgi:tetratricopeptide (TPR) repeat protein
MSPIIDQLIEFLTELQDMSLITQVLTLAGIPSVLVLLFGYPAWQMTRKVRDSVISYTALEARLKTAHDEAAKLKVQVDHLEAETSEAFILGHKREMKDGNDEQAMALAEAFLERQKEALLLAFHTRMDEAIRQSVEDGASAFTSARGWALASLAMSPRDPNMRTLADDLGDAAGIAKASGARVKLKDNEEREKNAIREQRLPNNIGALTDAFFKARDRGHYSVMLFLAGHGLMLTRRRPFGPGTREHLLFQRHRVEAMYYCGRSIDALDDAISVHSEFRSLFGVRDPEFFYSSYILTQCRKDTGDSAGALVELEEFLPIVTEVRGVRHTDVFNARYSIALCRTDMGDAAGALVELEELLLDQTDVLGVRHPHVLIIRSGIAYCRNETGDSTGALAEFEEILSIQTEVLGARHPDVLNTRIHSSRCQSDMGDVAGALVELEELLPTVTEVLGARHPYVLNTRGYIAKYQREMGDAATAIAELEELLPTVTEVKGPRNPSVLFIRAEIAQCQRDIGDVADALVELEELLPILTEVLGARHPDVLKTRTLRISCLLKGEDSGDALKELKAIREGLLAVNLHPDHKYFRQLEDIEKSIKDAN